MIVYRCDHCGDTITPRLRVTVRPAWGEQHFCSITCATTWTIWWGYHTPPAGGVVDAEIYCGAISRHGLDCKFTDGHPGSHVTHGGQEWAS